MWNLKKYFPALRLEGEWKSFPANWCIKAYPRDTSKWNIPSRHFDSCTFAFLFSFFPYQFPFHFSATHARKKWKKSPSNFLQQHKCSSFHFNPLQLPTRHSPSQWHGNILFCAPNYDVCTLGKYSKPSEHFHSLMKGSDGGGGRERWGGEGDKTLMLFFLCTLRVFHGKENFTHSTRRIHFVSKIHNKPEWGVRWRGVRGKNTEYSVEW